MPPRADGSSPLRADGSTALRLAHRGDWRRAPENSLPAILAALEIPACDGLEFDVRSAVDGTPVLLHDVTLSRVQGRRVRADRLTPAELAGFGIPTLADVLAAVPPSVFLDVEIKAVGERFVNVLEEGRGPNLAHTVISSFDEAALSWMGQLRPAWPRWLNTEDLASRTIDAALALGCAGVCVRWQALDERSITAALARGLTVAAWTVRRLTTFERLAALGVAAMCVEAAALDG